MKELFSALIRELEEGRGAVLATILSSRGSAPRGAGAWMLALEGGRLLGTIGGGAVEHEAARRAAELLRSGGSARQRYILTNGQAADLGMICGGEIEVYFQQFAPADRNRVLPVLKQAESLFSSGEKAWLAMALDGDGWRLGLCRGDSSPFPEVDTERLRPLLDRRCRFEEGAPALLVQPLCPDGTVYLFGAGHVGLALTHLLAFAGFRVAVYDQRERAAAISDAAAVVHGPYTRALELLPPITTEDYIVIMTPGHQGDYEVLSQALRTPARYIGCIGSRRKVAATRERLLADGFTPSDIDRVYAPIGLDIGGETPEEIAVSVAAQMIACRSGKLPQKGGAL